MTSSATAGLGSPKQKWERAFRASAHVQLQKDLCEYLRLLRDGAYKRLLKNESTESANLLIGELRVLQKLLGTLELESSTFQEDLE